MWRLVSNGLYSWPCAGYFRDRILFLTVSQSPDVDQLRAKIWGYIMGNGNLDSNYQIPQYKLQYEGRIGARILVVLDDVWSQNDLERLIFPGCKILVVSRFKFPKVIKATYEVELLTENEAMSLFCHSAFGQKSMPLGTNENLVKQVLLLISVLVCEMGLFDFRNCNWFLVFCWCPLKLRWSIGCEWVQGASFGT